MASKTRLERTDLLITPERTARLQQANVLVVGLGGVGSYAAEFLGRAGIGKMTIVDGDVVDITNINRQLPALMSTVGISKAQLMGARLLDINPDMQLTIVEQFMQPSAMDELIANGKFDWVLDCIDSFQPKMELIMCCKDRRVKIISSMGAGAKVDPSRVKVTDIFKTRECPLAQQIRKALKKRNVKSGFKVVTSEEPIIAESLCMTDGSNFKRSFYGTISYMPARFGLEMAAYVIRQIAGI